MARRSTSSKSATRPCKTKYSALYAGCNACSQLPSVDDVVDCVRDLVRSESSSTSSVLPRLTLTVSAKGMKVVRHAAAPVPAGARRRPGPRRAHHNTVRHLPSDIVLVGQGCDADVRAAVGLALHGCFDSDNMSGSWLHVYVYWFDDGGPDTAARFVRQISELTDTAQHREAVKALETSLIASGQLRPRSTDTDKSPLTDDFAAVQLPLHGRRAAKKNPAGKYARQRLSAPAASVYRQPEVEILRQSSTKASAADDCSWPEHQPRITPRQTTRWNEFFDGAEYIMWSQTSPASDSSGPRDDIRRRPTSLIVPRPLASLASELRARLATGAPILLPPKDYDTVSRSRGNLHGIEERRCVNVDIVGGDTSRRTPQTYL